MHAEQSTSNNFKGNHKREAMNIKWQVHVFYQGFCRGKNDNWTKTVFKEIIMTNFTTIYDNINPYKI